MALSIPFEHGTQKRDSTGSSSPLVFSGVTTQPGELLVLFIFSTGSPGGTASGVVGHDGKTSWGQVGETEQASNRNAGSVWVAHSSGDSGSVTLSVPSGHRVAATLLGITGAYTDSSLDDSFIALASTAVYGNPVELFLPGVHLYLGGWGAFESGTSVTGDGTEISNTFLDYSSQQQVVEYDASGSAAPKLSMSRSRDATGFALEVKPEGFDTIIKTPRERGGGSGFNNIDSDTFTPPANALILVFAQAMTTSGTITNVTGHDGGSGWVELVPKEVNPRFTCQLFGALTGDSPTNGKASITMPAGNDGQAHFLTIEGVDVSGTALDAIKQSDITNSYGNVITMSLPGITEMSISFYAVGSSGAIGVAVENTELFHFIRFYQDRSIAGAYKYPVGDSTPSASNFAVNLEGIGFALELAPASVANAPIAGDILATVNDPTISAFGTILTLGTVDQTLDNVVSVGSGGTANSGDVATTLTDDTLVADGSAIQPVSGDLDSVATLTRSVGLGEVSQPIFGDMVVTAGDASVVSLVIARLFGTFNEIDHDRVTQVSDGFVRLVPTGDLAVVLDDVISISDGDVQTPANNIDAPTHKINKEGTGVVESGVFGTNVDELLLLCAVMKTTTASDVPLSVVGLDDGTPWAQLGVNEVSNDGQYNVTLWGAHALTANIITGTVTVDFDGHLGYFTVEGIRGVDVSGSIANSIRQLDQFKGAANSFGVLSLPDTIRATVEFFISTTLVATVENTELSNNAWDGAQKHLASAYTYPSGDDTPDATLTGTNAVIGFAVELKNGLPVDHSSNLDGDATLSGDTLEALGPVKIEGNINTPYQSPTITAFGKTIYIGNFAAIAGDMTQESFATADTNISGDVDVILDDVISTGNGFFGDAIVGTIRTTLSNDTLISDGFIITNVDGDMFVIEDDIRIDGVGNVRISVTGDITFEDATLVAWDDRWMDPLENEGDWDNIDAPEDPWAKLNPPSDRWKKI